MPAQTNSTVIVTNSQAMASSALSMTGFIGLYLGLRVCLTFLFFRADPQAGAIAGLAINLLLLLPVALYSMGAASLTLRQALRLWPFRLVIAYLALSLASLAWSETQSKSVALGYWSAMAADVALVYLVLRAQPIAIAIESLLKGYIYGVFLLALVAWLSPTMQDLRLGDDDFLNPNAIGFACAFAAMFCQYLAPQGTRWKWLGIALAITLVRSLSKTSILAFLVAECFYLWRSSTIRRTTKLAIAGTGALILILFSSLFAAYYTVYTNAGDQAETLTGRTAIWIVTLGFALQQPWLGHGFHSFRNVVPAFGAFQPWHAHNELLHQFFVYGFAGVALLIALYTSLLKQLRSMPSSPTTLLTGSLLLMVVIRGLADTERFDLSFPLWMIAALTLHLAQQQEAVA